MSNDIISNHVYQLWYIRLLKTICHLIIRRSCIIYNQINAVDIFSFYIVDILDTY